MIFDANLAFKNLIIYKHLSKSSWHTDWRAVVFVLLHLYQYLVFSKLDDGCIVYGSACQSKMQLDPIHHQGLCIALRACHTSAQSFCMNAHESPLLNIKVVFKLSWNQSVPENPNYSCILEHLNVKRFEDPPSRIRPLAKFYLTLMTVLFTLGNFVCVYHSQGKSFLVMSDSITSVYMLFNMNLITFFLQILNYLRDQKKSSRSCMH